MSHKIFRLFVVMVLLIGLVAVEAPTAVRAAGPWYVSNAGDDNNDCLSPTTPCATINGAIGKASGGDTIYVAENTFAEAVFIAKDITLSGGWDASFTSQTGLSKVDGQGLGGYGISITDFGFQNVVVNIDRFMVENAYEGIHNGIRGFLTVSNSVLGNNGIGGNDTGIFSWGPSLTLNDSSVTGNGLGIFVSSGNVILNNSIVSRNNRGGLYLGGTVSMNNSVVRDNITSGGGGGIYMSPSSLLEINNSTITNNAAGVGGGIYLAGNATLNINNSTISANKSDTSGGGISPGLSYGPNTIALQNSILANNISATGPDCSGTIDTTSHNIIGDTTGCTVTAGAGDQFDVNPRTSPYPVGALGYFTLLADSPAVDTGDPATCLPNDQRGMARPQGGGCDIGAYEYVASPGTATFFGYLSGTNQRTTPDAALPNPFVVYTLDDNGSAVPGVSVTFTAPSSGPSGTFADSGTNITTVPTDSSGVSISPTFTANSEPGGYEVIATASGFADSVPFTLTNAAWFVATTGNDSNACNSPASPCLTINAAIDKAQAGETIYVASGTYTGVSDFVVSINKNITLSGSWDPSFTSRGAPSIIDGQGVHSGIFVDQATTTIEFFTIQNGSTFSAGGILSTGSLTLLNSLITRNRVESQFGGGGAGILSYGTLVIRDTTISDNLAGQGGGGLYISGSSTDLNNVNISNNTSHGTGGGIVAYGFGANSNTLTITNSVVSDNNARYDGGGIHLYQFNLTMNNSTVARNRTEPQQFTGGGGIFGSDATITINNSTISGNTAYKGGGIYVTGGSSTNVNMHNTTIAYNTASIGGGVINDGNNSAVTLRNSVLARNTGLTDGPDCIYGALSSDGYNILGNTSSCTFNSTASDLTNIDPLIGLLVGLPGYHSLLQGSPAINAGNPTGCTDQEGNLITKDERGADRVGNCDIGAYEYTTPGPAASISLVGSDNQSTSTLSEFPNPLQAAALDDLGSPVGGISVDFTAPGSGPSGSFSDTGNNITTAITDEGGVATASIFTANDQPGIYTVSASSSGLGSVVFNLEQFARPANDDFANAEIIATLPFNDSVEITNATLELNEPAYCGSTDQSRSVWYSFTPSTGMVVSVDTLGSSFSDTNLTLYQSVGPGFGGLSFLRTACSGSSMTFDFQAGTTYYLQAESYSSGSGDLHLNLQQVPPPANDNFVNADAITSLPFSATVEITGATAEPDEPFSCSYSPKSVWYVFTPTENTTVRLDMTGSQVGGAVGIYRVIGSGIANLSPVACSFTGGSTTNIQLAAGEIYYLQMVTYTSGTLQLNLEQITPPANDNFADAEAINGFPFDATADNTNATTEPGEPQGCSFPFRSVWYTFTPTENMVLQLNIDSQVSASANIFVDNGSGLSGLTSLLCAYLGPAHSQNFQVEAGTRYYLRVDTSGQPGTIQVNLQQLTPPANDRFDGAENIASLPFSVALDNTSASMEFGETSVCGFPFRSVWYAFTPSETMSTRIQNTSQLYGAIDIYRADGPGLADLAFLGCAFNGSSTNIRLEAGQTYYLRVDSNGVAGELQFNWEQIIPPANDDFGNAEEIGSLPFNVSVDNSDATIEPGEPLGCGVQNRSVWYSFTPTENVMVRANTAGSAVSGIVEIYEATGTGISDLIFRGCAGSSSTNVQFEAGRTYYLRIDTFGQAGLIQVNLERLNPPANDNLANAENIMTQPFHATADLTDATMEQNEPVFCYYMPNTVWYTLTPTETMTLRADTLGSPIGGNVNIYQSTGPGFSGLQFLNCSGPSNTASFLAEAGQTYYLQVGSTSGQTGIVNLNLVQPVPPANDDLANATTVTSLPFTDSVDITDATNEPGEPQICNFTPNTVWYSFTPNAAIKLRADTMGGTISGNVNIYRVVGNGFAGLEFIQCTGLGGATAFLAEAGQTYYFQVGSTGQAGTIRFNLAEVPVITGRIVDAVTGAPLPGDIEPFTTAYLYRICGDSCLEFVNSTTASGAGQVSFDSYYYGAPLLAGSYQIDVNANLYLTKSFGPFEFTGDSLNVGDLALTPQQTQIQVSIDIVPGNATNVINLRASTVQVAILSSDGFNAVSDVNRSSLTFGKTGNESSFVSCAKGTRDVNNDGRPDLICTFRIALTGLLPGDVQAILRGQTLNGSAFEGMDFVKVAGSKNH